MLLQKTLHLSHSVTECKARLGAIQSYRRRFAKVTRASITSSKTIDFGFRGPLGFEARTVLLGIESGSTDQLAFESVGGNIELLGLVDFAEIRANCTEITLMVNYEIKSKLFAWLDRRFKFVDAFAIAELRNIRAHFEGVAAPVMERPAMMPMFETATA